MHRTIHIFLTCLWICCAFAWATAQSEAESASGSLELQSKSGLERIIIPTNSKIGVKYTMSPRRYHGQVLEAVLDSAVVLSGDKVGVKYISEISVRDEYRYRIGKYILLISAGVIVAFWVLLILIFTVPFYAIGVYLFLVAIAFILGLAATLAFPAGIITGLILMILANKTYRLRREWNLTTHPSQPHTDD